LGGRQRDEFLLAKRGMAPLRAKKVLLGAAVWNQAAAQGRQQLRWSGFISAGVGNVTHRLK
jgi:hypothetical protein